MYLHINHLLQMDLNLTEYFQKYSFEIDGKIKISKLIIRIKVIMAEISKNRTKYYSLTFNSQIQIIRLNYNRLFFINIIFRRFVLNYFCRHFSLHNFFNME